MGSQAITTKMKTLLSLCVVLTISGLSHQAYPSIQRAPPQPVCRQVPKEVCNQVPRTTTEQVPEEVCEQKPVQDRKCQISQRPVQEQVQRQECRLTFKQDCKTA